MNKNDYLKIVKKKIKNKKSRMILNEQIETYFDLCEYSLEQHNYKIGDNVYLSKDTLLHGTYKNIDGLKEIVGNGLIAGAFVGGRNSKYPFSVGVWNLKKDFLLKDYIDFYSGGTIGYEDSSRHILKTEVIPYSKMTNVFENIKKNNIFRWNMEQTKEARFMPSLIQNEVQIGIIFNVANSCVKNLFEKDILTDFISDENVKPFIHDGYYFKFLHDRKNKNDFFTDRESAILFGIPTNFIAGILVGRDYEKDNKVLKEIKNMLPWVYICNLDGRVIVV